MKILMTVSLILFAVSCSKSTPEVAKERTVHSIQDESATCLTSYIKVTDAGYAEAVKVFSAGECPSSIKILGENLTFLKKCGKYQDIKNGDPNSYNLSVYSKTVKDGKLVTQSAAEATEFCTSYLDSTK